MIDYVAPYYDQTGIMILLRQQAPEPSMFKFMKVLQPTVWAGICAAVAVVSVLIWLLDRQGLFLTLFLHSNDENSGNPSRLL